jgi:hypothetical protein
MRFPSHVVSVAGPVVVPHVVVHPAPVSPISTLYDKERSISLAG